MADDTPVRERLEQPVEQATRAVALRLLQKVDGERRRVDDPRDKEALHDFRVALRRLRSWLRAYKAPLRGSVCGKDRDTLRAVARATNAGRDAEVHVEWLRARAEFFRPGRRKGTEWLIKQLQARGRAATETLSKKVSGDFAPLRRKLMDRLKVYTRRVDDASTEVTFAVATSLLVRDHAEALREKIASVRGPRDQKTAHQARIAAKHLRYLLEPLAREAPGAAALLSRLEELQDTLGALHDAHVFGDEVAAAMAASTSDHRRKRSRTLLDRVPRLSRLFRPEPDPARAGLQAIARTLREGMEESYAAFARQWTVDGANGFWTGVADVAVALRTSSREGEVTRRRYLLAGLPRQARVVRSVDIVQGYVPGDRLVERLSRVSDDGAKSFYRRVQAGQGAARTEVEEAITPATFDRMWPLTQGHRFTKRRRRMPDGGLTWQIDEFTDRRLVLAEVELPAAGTAVEIPPWLRPLLVREVTGEEEFLGARLAR
jgi:CHAD domain-containing protein/CYTH domain-containing protein